MSSLKEKMGNYELTPPANAWDRIAAALDESMQEALFPARLHGLEIEPPAGSWEKITAGLQEDVQYPARLRAMEIDPPAKAWDHIAASLEQGEKPAAIVVNHPARFKQILRYMVAAAVIGAVAFGILQWTGSTDKQSAGIAIVSGKTDSGNKKQNPPANTVDVPAIRPAQNNSDTDPDSRLIARLERPYKTPARKTGSAIQTAVYSPDMPKARAIYTYDDHVPSIADRYIMLMTPDGNLIRMSKKWGNLVCCVSGEDPEADCKDQLKKWQEKMATSSLTTSTGNFMDLLNLVNALDEGSDL